VTGDPGVTGNGTTGNGSTGATDTSGRR
jgi:hypothetical protein